MAETTTAAPSRREYETIYILRADVTRESSEKVSKRVQEVVDREKAKLTLVETWGRRSMAYKIRKQRYGIYVYLRYLAPTGVVEEIERNFRLSDDVVRFQTVLLNREVDEAAEIDPENVEFEDVEGVPTEEAEGMTLAQELGLEDAPRRDRRDSEGEPAADAKADAPKADAKADAPKADAKADAPKADAPKADAKADAPKADAAAPEAGEAKAETTKSTEEEK